MKAVSKLVRPANMHLKVLLLLVCCSWVSCEDDVISKFFSGYDKALRPGFEMRKPTTILAEIYVESFGNIEEANMEYKVYSYFRQRWKDPRLAGKLNHTLVIKGSDIGNIWVPDPYCYNARESNMMMPDEEIHSSVSIQPTGDVLYSKGVTVLASCNMDLHSFPHDSQKCFLKFGSYSYTSVDITFQWNVTKVDIGTKQMAQFDYEGTELSSDVEAFSVGTYSTITVTFFFKRRLGYFLIQVYLPNVFVVLLSWIVFWMQKDDIGNRMALGITCILTIMFLLGSLNGNLPKVSYPKAMDWYLLMSFVFVFLALVECIIVYVLNFSAIQDRERIKCKVNEVPLSRKISSSIKAVIGTKSSSKSPTRNGNKGKLIMGADDDLEMVHRANKTGKTVVDDGSIAGFIGTSKKETAAGNIDKASRALFPLSFVILNVVYWVYFSLTG